MKNITMLAAGVGLALGVVTSQAQTGTSTALTTVPIIPYGGGGYVASYGPDCATNPIQGFDYGRARVIEARGENAELSADAALKFSEARRRQVENWKKFVATSFEVRKIYHDARVAERGRPLTSADYIRMAQIGKPQRLSPSQLNRLTGELAWPAVLDDGPFASYRQVLDRLFAKRAERGRLGFHDTVRADRTAATMTEMLRERIAEVPVAEYMAARRFLESLAYESKLAAPEAETMRTAALRVTQR